MDEEVIDLKWEKLTLLKQSEWINEKEKNMSMNMHIYLVFDEHQFHLRRQLIYK